MKKSLLALAVLASIAGVASAQSSVTIYGVVDAGITNERGGAAGSITKVATGVQSGNRLGFKGTEDLGGGLKANFQLENGFNLDTGTQRQGGRLFGRQAWVGLSSSAGSVNLGRQYIPLFVALDSIDPFGTGLTGNSTNLMSAGKADIRIDNSITYAMPEMNGFNASALYGAGESTKGNKVGRTVGVGASYNRGPLLVTAAASQANANQAAAPADVTTGERLFLIGATYNFGPVIAHAAFETEKGNTGDNKNFRDYLLGATVPYGPGSFFASFIKKDDRNTASDKGAKQFGLGYTYSLSKRTNLYTSYARIDNDSGAKFVVGDASSGGTAVGLGQNSSAVTVGMRHKF